MVVLGQIGDGDNLKVALLLDLHLNGDRTVRLTRQLNISERFWMAVAGVGTIVSGVLADEPGRGVGKCDTERILLGGSGATGTNDENLKCMLINLFLG